MRTTLLLSIAGPDDPGTSHEIEVTETFDRVVDVIAPLQQASSALEARSRIILTRVGGGRVFVRPEVIAAITETTP